MDIFQKNYLDPVKIMKRVVAKRPDARMVMLGGNFNKSNKLQAEIRHNNLEKSIEWVPYTTNVAEYYQGAKIHLLTSSFETSPMVVAESRSYGIPLVTYDLPYLEILKDGKGYIAVEQGNTQAAADAILRLLNNQTLCEEMSKEAKESIREFGKFNLEQEWQDVFDELEHERPHKIVQQSEQEKNLSLFMKTMFFHYKKSYTSEGLPKVSHRHNIIKIFLVAVVVIIFAIIFAKNIAFKQKMKTK